MLAGATIAPRLAHVLWVAALPRSGLCCNSLRTNLLVMFSGATASDLRSDGKPAARSNVAEPRWSTEAGCGEEKDIGG